MFFGVSYCAFWRFRIVFGVILSVKTAKNLYFEKWSIEMNWSIANFLFFQHSSRKYDLVFTYY